MISHAALIRLLATTMLFGGLAACGSSDTAKTESATTTTETQVADAAAPPTVAAPAVAPAAVPATPDVTYASLTGDAAKGEKLFVACKTCHVAEAGINRIGPSLWGVVGRPAGSIAGFRYSAANKNSGATWTEETLFTYLRAPRTFMPGTLMTYAGMKPAQDRADVIAYLKTRA